MLLDLSAALLRRSNLGLLLLRDLRRKVRFEAVFQHGLFRYGLEIEMRRAKIVHEPPVKKS
jgi:hypothetical protein